MGNIRWSSYVVHIDFGYVLILHENGACLQPRYYRGRRVNSTTFLMCNIRGECIKRMTPQRGEKLDERVFTQLAEIGRRPALVRSFFKHPCVAYITDY